MVAAAVIGSAVVGGVMQSDAANRASRRQGAANDAALKQEREMFDISMQNSNAQHAASLALQRHIASMSIGEQRRQFNIVRQTLAPYITAGNQALGDLTAYRETGQDALQGQRALIGLNGEDAQSAAIAGLQNSPEMAAYLQQGENAMLQNAAATGGLRGGNTQAAMAQFRPNLLASMIGQQYERLGGLTALGANTSGMVYQTGAGAAAGQAQAGMQVAGNIASTLGAYAGNAANAYNSLSGQQAGMYQNMGNAYSQYYQNQGAIGAGNALAQGAAWGGVANAVQTAAFMNRNANLASATVGGITNSGAGFSPVNYSLSGGGGVGLRF